MKFFITFFGILAIILSPAITFARAGLVASQGIWLSKEKVFAGDRVKIYTIVNNDTYEKLSAQVEFFSNGKLIGTTQLSEVPRELAKQLWVEHTFEKGIAYITVNLTSIVAINADGTQAPIPADAKVTREVSADFDIDVDTDRDGAGDREDTDDDNDGLSDEDELNRGTNPQNSDTDGDGLSDKKESDMGTDPQKADTDGDSLSDSQEVAHGTDPKKKDTDGDGLSDKEEITHGTSGTKSDSDGDGLSDGQEVKSNTNPLKADSDTDGLKDNDELRKGSNPVKKDTDGDGLGDGQEVTLGTDVKMQDTDNDGVSDGFEVKEGTNPLVREFEESPGSTTTLVQGLESDEGEVLGEKEFAPEVSSPMKWPFIAGSLFSFLLFIIFYGVYLQKRNASEGE